MSFLDHLTAFLPLGKKEEKLEYFFAVSIRADKLTAALWAIQGRELKILDIAAQDYTSDDEIVSVIDKLLDQVLGLKEIEPQKILFGVPDSWVAQDNLKEEYLKLLRTIVKELELAPMAYVATTNALTHFLEKQEGVPTTAILVGVDKLNLTVAVVRAGKIDGVKLLERGQSAPSDIEKALAAFTQVKTLPSKILIYGAEAEDLKSGLLSYPWMSKLSFLHFPKIAVLDEDTPIKSVCLAGGSEINESVIFSDQPIKKQVEKANVLMEEGSDIPARRPAAARTERDEPTKLLAEEPISPDVLAGPEELSDKESLGFMVGDITKDTQNHPELDQKEPTEEALTEADQTEDVGEKEEDIESREVAALHQEEEIGDFGTGFQAPAASISKEFSKFNLMQLIRKNFTILSLLFGVLGVAVLLVGAYLFLLKADVKIFVEPKTLEKDAEVTADPNQKAVDEAGKIIPGQIVETEVSGTAKDTATGTKQIGDPAKGTAIIRNKTDSAITLSKGTVFSSSNGLKFTLDMSVNVASRSADDGTWGKANGTVTATDIGADGNIPSGTDLAIAGYGTDKAAVKAEGNFTGGTSKQVTVVSSDDVQRLLAKLSSDLRKQAQQQLQDKYPNKKILGEALSENITKKTYNKNINDQAGEFALNLTIRFKGTAFDAADLRTIVSKLVTTQVPDGFKLDLSDTETQADVSKLEKDGKLVFLAKFKAKLIPEIDTAKIKNQIKFKSPAEVVTMLKGIDNVLGAEITLTPNLPHIISRLPLLSKNITIEVGLK